MVSRYKIGTLNNKGAEKMPNEYRKIAVVGVGAVGASTAYALLISGLVSELVLVDIDRKRAEGEAMDLAHGTVFAHPVKVYAGTWWDCRDADIIVFTAGAHLKPGQTRLELVHKNIQVLRETLPGMMDRQGDSVLLMVSNPVDVLTYAALRITRVPSHRVIGSGTVLDSARFRHLLSEYYPVEPRNIHAYVVGEHGDSEVLLWSKANIAGLSLDEYCALQNTPCPGRQKVEQQVKNAAYEVISRKGATYYAISLVVRRICESILRDENSILTVSSLIEGVNQISDVCLSMPCIINRQGRAKVLSVPLSEAEAKELSKSAAILQAMQNKNDFGTLANPVPRIGAAPDNSQRPTSYLH